MTYNLSNAFLPLIDRTPYPRTQPRRRRWLARSLKILLIDDNADALNCLKMLIKVHGHQVATALSGAEGLEQTSQFRPSLVFLDLWHARNGRL